MLSLYRSHTAFWISAFLSVLPLPLRAGLVWPTPNPAFQQGKPIEAFVQPTASGEPESGLFGCVRNNGHRFHEGLDLFPVKRSSKGEALDEVYAVLPGRVAYANETAGYSSYGRYVVVEHDGEKPALHTLYAHLASVADGIRPGARVEAGTVLGIMGRSAAGYTIPRERSHVHFEMGFRLTDDFQSWYDRQQYGSKNRHGNWNGMNMVGVNPLEFYQAMRSGEVSDVGEFLRRIKVVARVRIHSGDTPDFVKNYPELLMRPLEGGEIVAWDVGFSAFGVPLQWMPRFAGEGISGKSGEISLLAYDREHLESQTCRKVVEPGGTRPQITSVTRVTIAKLFGFR